MMNLGLYLIVTTYGVCLAKRLRTPILVTAILYNLLRLQGLNYFSKSSSLDIMDYLRNQKDLGNVYFFMNCHQTPFYSHLHK